MKMVILLNAIYISNTISFKIPVQGQAFNYNTPASKACRSFKLHVSQSYALKPYLKTNKKTHPMQFFTEILKSNLKVNTEIQKNTETQNSQKIPEQWKCQITIPDFKLFYKAIVIKPATGIKTINITEVHTHTATWFLIKSKTIHWRKDSIFNK